MTAWKLEKEVAEDGTKDGALRAWIDVLGTKGLEPMFPLKPSGSILIV